MYQVLYGTSYAQYSGTGDLNTTGLITLSQLINGERTGVSESINGKFDITLGRANEDGGPVILPLHKNGLRVAGTAYEAGTAFSGTIECPDVENEIGDATIVISKKGLAFNERNNWTANIAIRKDISGSALASKLTDLINSNTNSHGLVATVSGSVISISGSKLEDDYNISLTDLLSNATGSFVAATQGKGLNRARLDALMSKGAADAGFNDTYLDGATLLYANYPFNPDAAAKGDEGWGYVNIVCGEPRDFKTHEETVFQNLTVIFPTANISGAKDLYDTLVEAGAEDGGFQEVESSVEENPGT